MNNLKRIYLKDINKRLSVYDVCEDSGYKKYDISEQEQKEITNGFKLSCQRFFTDHSGNLFYFYEWSSEFKGVFLIDLERKAKETQCKH